MNEKKNLPWPKWQFHHLGLIAGRDLCLAFEVRKGHWMGCICHYRQKCNLQISIISISTESHDWNPSTGIPVTPWKTVQCCAGTAIRKPYPYLSVPVTGYPRCYLYPCHSLFLTLWKSPEKRAKFSQLKCNELLCWEDESHPWGWIQWGMNMDKFQSVFNLLTHPFWGGIFITFKVCFSLKTR